MPQAGSIRRMELLQRESPSSSLLASGQALPTSSTLSIPSSQMAHPPRVPQQLHEAAFPQAPVPSLRVQVSLLHLGFKAGGTSSCRDRSAETSPQKLDPFSTSAAHPERLAGEPQDTLLGQPQRIGEVPQSSLVLQDSAQLRSHWVSDRGLAPHWFCHYPGPPAMREGLNRVRFTVSLRHQTGSFPVAWQSLPFPHFLYVGQKGKGGTNLGPLGKVCLFTPVICRLFFIYHVLAITNVVSFTSKMS